MDATSIGVAEEEDYEQGIDEQDIFNRVVLFLAALTHALRGTVKVFFTVFQDALARFWISEEPRRWSAWR
jgi:hypothetical protein